MKRTLAIMGTIALIASVAAVAITTSTAAPRKSKKNTLRVQRNNQNVHYDTVSTRATVSDRLLVLEIWGYADPVELMADDEYSDHLRLEINPYVTLQTGVNYPINGTASWDLGTGGKGYISPSDVTFTDLDSNTSAIQLVYFYRSCFCWFPGQGSQIWSGSISFRRNSKGRLAGTVTLDMQSPNPFDASSVDTYRISSRFDVRY